MSTITFGDKSVEDYVTTKLLPAGSQNYHAKNAPDFEAALASIFSKSEILNVPCLG